MGKLESIQTFVEIVQREGISEAARHLGIAKSAVSRRLKELEGNLGAQLINRTVKGFNLTPEGSVFYERCLNVLEDLSEAETFVAKGSKVLSGNLRITAPMSFGVLHLTPLIGEFLKIHKNISVELDLNDRLVDLVGEGFDIGIRISGFENSSLIGRKIAAVSHLAVASPNYLAKNGLPKTPGDLIRHKGLVYSHVDLKQYWRFDTAKSNGKVDPSRISSQIKANNGEVLKDFAIAGLGIAVLPSFIVDSAVAEGKLIVILQDYQRPPVHLYMIYQDKKHPSLRAETFVDFVLNYFAKPKSN